MRREKFAKELCDYLEERIVEICKKFEEGNVNGASLPAFWIGLEADVESFLTEHKLTVEGQMAEEDD